MTRKFLIPTENQEQRALVKWLSLHPVLKDFYCKNNNEGKRTEAQGWNLKLMGLRAGVSDLTIYFPTKLHHGLFLEVKRAMNYPVSARKSETWIAQEEFARIVRSVGYEAKTCFCWQDGVKIIENYLNCL
jgi:hypothetical protein